MSMDALATRAALSALSSDLPTVAYVREVKKNYFFDSSSSATVDGWCVLTSGTGSGRWIIEGGEPLQLPVAGGGADDWANFSAALNACTPRGIAVYFAGYGTVGEYQCKTRQEIPSNAHIICCRDTRIKTTLAATNNLYTPFTCRGAALSGVGNTDTIAVQSYIGDNTITVSGDMTYTAGDYIGMAYVQYRCAIYKVISVADGTGDQKVLTLDRSLMQAQGPGAIIFETATYKGSWDAATNTPTLTSGVGTEGDFYIVSVAGTTNIDGVSSWEIGEYIGFNGSAWFKSTQTDKSYATASTSFPVGTYVQKFTPTTNVRIDFNGATVYGYCNRYFEMWGAIDCGYYGPVYAGDGTATTAVERCASIDCYTYRCRMTDIISDGGGVQTIGISFESSEASFFERCDIRNVNGPGIFHQDSVNCTDLNCRGTASTIGIEFGAAADNATPTGSGSVWGSIGAKSIGGIFQKNYINARITAGSYLCNIISGTLEGGTTSVSDLGGFDFRIGGGSRIRKSFNGVYLQPGSIRFVLGDTSISGCGNSVYVLAGVTGAKIDGAVISNSTQYAVLAYSDVTIKTANITHAVAMPAIHIEPDVTVCAQHLDATKTVANFQGIIFAYGGTFVMDSGTLTAASGGAAVETELAGVVRLGNGVTITGHGATGWGVRLLGTSTLERAPGCVIDAQSVLSAGGTDTTTAAADRYGWSHYQAAA